MAVFLTLLLVVTMLPAAGMQTAFADEPNAATTDAASEGLLYKVSDGKATLVGFDDGASLEGDVVVPESVDGATVTAVEMAEGQVADKVTSLTLPQTVESVRTEGLASAFPKLSSIEVDGTEGVYSTSGGMLFLQGKDAASSDGSTTLAKNRELVWAPPALVVARLPIECKSIASGAFVDAYALETVMCPGVMESIAVAEKDDDGNVTVPGAFTDEQIASLSIVVPGTNIASPSGDRVSASVALSEDEGMEAKREAWWRYGFNSDKIVMGTSFGEVEGVVAVSDEGTVEDTSIDVLKPYEKKQLAEAAEAGDASAAARLAAPEGSGLSFSYNADMNLSVFWAGDKTTTPATVEIPAYVTIDGVKYAVTEIAPEAFKGAVFLTSVTVPEGVRIIGESVFENCSNLKEVSLPSTLRTIDYAAFKGCAALESVEIPDSVTWIGGEAFEDGVAGFLSPEDERAGAESDRGEIGVAPSSVSNDGVEAYYSGSWTDLYPDSTKDIIVGGQGIAPVLSKDGYKRITDFDPIIKGLGMRPKRWRR